MTRELIIIGGGPAGLTAAIYAGRAAIRPLVLSGGLPGGQIEWGESPRKTAQRELREELHVFVPELLEVGAYSYKRALHMVYAAPLTDEILKYDDTELLDIGWFTETAVETMKADRALHADYELEAIRKLKLKLGR